jgi:aspartate 1-decarboxylase
MQRIMLKSKIQEVKITNKEIQYSGSLGIDKNLMEAADIMFGEQIHIYDVTNGARLVTYAIPAPAGSGIIAVKGAAGRLMEKGDTILVVAFNNIDESDLASYTHKIVYVDDKNQLVKIDERTEEDYLKM